MQRYVRMDSYKLPMTGLHCSLSYVCMLAVNCSHMLLTKSRNEALT